MREVAPSHKTQYKPQSTLPLRKHFEGAGSRPAEMLGPYRIPAGRKHAVGIDGILQCFMKPLQGMIVEGIDVHHRLLENRCRPILAPAVPAAHLDQTLEPFAVALVRGRILRHRCGENENEGSFPETLPQRARPK